MALIKGRGNPAFGAIAVVGQAPPWAHSNLPTCAGSARCGPRSSLRARSGHTESPGWVLMPWISWSTCVVGPAPVLAVGQVLETDVLMEFSLW